MLIGGLIGYERESTHRPAGIRTHMLVAVGATVVMMLGNKTLQTYHIMTTIDPSRLGAQVISGIGFLGAGTIMKEGHTIKGLTTAASLWVVGCLGLCVGAGEHLIAIIGFIACLITLRSFSRVSKNVTNGKFTRFEISFFCHKETEILSRLGSLSGIEDSEINSLRINEDKNGRVHVEFLLYTNKKYSRMDVSKIVENLTEVQGVNNVQMIAF